MQQTYSLRLVCICCWSSWSMSSGTNKVWCLTDLFSAFHYHHLIPRPVPCWLFSPWSLHPSHALPIWWEGCGGKDVLRMAWGTWQVSAAGERSWVTIGLWSGAALNYFLLQAHTEFLSTAQFHETWELNRSLISLRLCLCCQIWLKLANTCKIMGIVGTAE